MRINYISNLKITEQTGGWDGINYCIYNELIKYAKVNLCEGINPKANLFEHAISKLLRVSGVKGNFFFFSKKRLNEIASSVKKIIDEVADLDFYFGVTPWIHYTPQRPYGAYLDASFKTYLDIYSQPSKFSEGDITRICKEEETWLSKAKWVFWGSNWALREASMQYGFDPLDKKHLVINTGGNVPVPAAFKKRRDGIRLLFISLNFEKKGGFVCFDAFKLLQKEFSEIELNIIGQRPPEEIMTCSGVNYVGLLNKKDPEQLNELIGHFESATFLVHPTKMDTMGAVIVEAGYYGTPSIAPRLFGIPDLIVDGNTGYLIDDVKPEVIAQLISRAIGDKGRYQEMRDSCYKFYTNNFSWKAIGNKMINHLKEAFKKVG